VSKRIQDFTEASKKFYYCGDDFSFKKIKNSLKDIREERINKN